MVFTIKTFDVLGIQYINYFNNIFNFKNMDMKNGLNKHSFGIQIICIPIVWVIALLKILIAIPVYIIKKCNYIMEDVE